MSIVPHMINWDTCVANYYASHPPVMVVVVPEGNQHQR